MIRLFVVAGGGMIIGWGFPVLRNRAAFYRAIDIPDGVRAMYALMVVNACALTFAAVVLLYDRWDHQLSWRIVLVGTMFLTKGLFFVWLNMADREQERRQRFSQQA